MSTSTPISEEEPSSNLVEQLLDEIIESAHPLMVDAFFCAALPHWYDLDLFTAIRAKDDDRNEGLIPRLDKYSFVLPLPDRREPTFRVRDTERQILNERWIAEDAAAYVAAHERGHAYWQAHTVDSHGNSPNGGTGSGGTDSGDSSNHTHDAVDEVTQEQNELYHHYFVDLAAATGELGTVFRSYRGDRLLAAIERLLHMADEARGYLRLLHGSDLNGSDSNNSSSNNPTSNSPDIPTSKLDPNDFAHFDHLVDHLHARQAQLQGNWLESMAMFEALRNTPGLTPELVPFVAHGYARSLKETGLYVESIEEYKRAISLFKKQAAQQSRQSTDGQMDEQPEYLTSHAGLKVEQGLAMIDLGEAYVDFALSANVDPSKGQQSYGWWERVQSVYEFFTALPLVAYLSIYIGRRVWHPSFWRVLDNLDWIIGRLFGKGADQYLRADKILGAYGSEADAVLANEKLASLYLKMGDFTQARTLFTALLEMRPSPLSDYHRALVRRGLAEAEMALSEPETARLYLQQSLPVLRAYEDSTESAEAQSLLAETLLAAAEPTQALDQFGQVLSHYQQTGNREKATSIYERMGMLLRSGRLDADDTERAQTLADQVIERRYPVRFRSLTTIFTQRALLALLTLVFVLMPLWTIQLESGTQIVPEINFRVPPLLQDGAEFKPDLSVGVTALSVTDVSEAEVWLRLSALLMLLYLLFITLMGVLAIISTPMHRMQRSMQAKTIDVDGEGIRFGGERVAQAMPWRTVRKFLRSDMSMFTERLRVDDSLTVLASELPSEKSNLLTIRGSTAWYTSLVDGLAARLPDDSTTQTISFSWLRCWAGLLYGLGLLIFMLLTWSMWLQKSEWLLTFDLPLLRYSIFDLYPYFYMMLFVPPMLWFVVRPLRIRSYLAPYSRLPWAVGGAGVLLFAARVITQFRPWLTVPDIYPAGVILFLVVGAAATIWQARDPVHGSYSFSYWPRVVAATVALLITIVVGTNVTRDMVAYHNLVNGHYFRDQEQTLMTRQTRPISQKVENRSKELLGSAIDYYKEARRIAKYPLPWILQIDTSDTDRYGFPEYDQTIWFAATKSVADIATKLGSPDIKPQDLYRELFAYVPESKKAELYISQALALTGQVTQFSEDSGSLQQNKLIYTEAIAKFTEAIKSSDTEDAAQYRLWRGVARHALYSSDHSEATSRYKNIENDYLQVLAGTENVVLDDALAAKAQVGLGWLRYQVEYQKAQSGQNFQAAFGHFQQATIYDPQSVEALLGIGYVHYQRAEQAIDEYKLLPTDVRSTNLGKRVVRRANRKLRDAELVWLQAQKLDSHEPSIPISLATVHWKLANPSINLDIANRCAEYKKANELLDEAVRRDKMRIQQDVDVAFSFRTRGFTTWLLQAIDCPELDKIETIEQSITYFSKAIELDPDNASYWHMRARLNNELVSKKLEQDSAIILKTNRGAIQKEVAPLLISALDDMDRALRIDPQDDAEIGYRPNYFLGSIIDKAFDNGYSLVRQNDLAQATELYKSAITTTINYRGHRERVENATDRLAVRLAIHPSVEGGQILQALERTGVVLDLKDPTPAFNDAADLLAAGDEANSLNTYQRALRLAIDTGNIRSVALALMAQYEVSDETDGAPSESVIELFRQAFPQLTQIQQSKSHTDALNLAFIAAAVGKTPIASYWYAEGIRRSTTQGPSVGMSNSAQAVRLSSTWQNNGVTLQTMLNDIPKAISDQQFLYPELVDNDQYWHTWAWSLYFLGRESFLAGDEEAAEAALEVGQPYADRAAALGRVGGDVVHTYYPEGALSWYHFVRAKGKQDEGDHRGALADYSLAVIVSRADTNETAIEERAQAAFRAGLMALMIDNEPLAFTWYKQGRGYVQNDADKGDMVTQLAKAIDELRNAIDTNPALKSNGEPILGTLIQAQETE